MANTYCMYLHCADKPLGNIMSSDTSLSHQDNEPSAKGKGRYLDIRSLQNPAVEDEPNETEGPQSFLDGYSAVQSLIGPADYVDKSSQNMGMELDSFPKKGNETGGQSVDIPKRPEKHLTKVRIDVGFQLQSILLLVSHKFQVLKVAMAQNLRF